MKRPSLLFISMWLAVALQIHSVAHADETQSRPKAVKWQAPDNLEILKEVYGMVLPAAGVGLLVFLIFRIMLGRDVRLIKDRNKRSWALYHHATKLLKQGAAAEAKMKFMAASDSFDRPGFHLEQALAVMGAADAAEALNDFDEARRLYGAAEKVLLEHPAPHQDPTAISYIRVDGFQLERSRAYEAALVRCRAGLSAFGSSRNRFQNRIKV